MAAKKKARGSAALDEVTADVVKAAQGVAKVAKAAVEVVVDRVSKRPRAKSAKKKGARAMKKVAKKTVAKVKKKER